MLIAERLKINPPAELERRLVELVDLARFTYNFLLADVLRSGSGRPAKKAILGARNRFRTLVRAGSVPNKHGEIYGTDFQKLLRGAPSQLADMACDDVDRAWKTLKKRSAPSFKRKDNARQSFTLHRKADSTFKLVDGSLRVAGLSFYLPLSNLRFLESAEQVRRVTISQEAYGWYLSVLVEVPDGLFHMEPNGRAVGIDWGVKTFASDSDGNSFSFKQLTNYGRYCSIEKNLRRLQAALARKRIRNPAGWRHSTRYARLKAKVAWAYSKLANIRKDFLHRVSKFYTDHYDEIHIEDLKPSNLLKNHRLARSVSEAMFYTWKVMLMYKSLWKGGTVILKNPRNTSQTCAHCGHVLAQKLTLSDRVFECPECGHSEDRDLNAAKNILAVPA